MRRPLTQEEKEAQKHWERITEILAQQQGQLEIPARLLSFDELLNLKNQYVWLETFNPNEIKACEIYDGHFNKNIVEIFSGGFYSLLRKNYGIKYQCWTANPTDEQKRK